MAKVDYKKKSDKDLLKELKEKKDALRNFRLSMWGSKTRDTKEGGNLKKDIARIMTEINARKQ